MRKGDEKEVFKLGSVAQVSGPLLSLLLSIASKFMKRSLLLSSFLACLLAGSSAVAEKPNILFLFADDQCYETIRSLGHTDIDTPNLDRLVSSGTTFTHTYNMGSWSGAVCVASRTMLNTGRFVWEANGVYGNLEKERQEGRLWTSYLHGAGYDTYFTGKWHVKVAADKTFKTVSNVRGGMPKQTEAGYNRPLADGTDPWDPADPKFGGFWEGGTHWSEVVANDAVDFLGAAAKKEDPFFMYIAFNAPHDPRQAPQSYLDRYPLDRIKLPENFLSDYPERKEIGLPDRQRDERLAPHPRSEHAVKVNRKEYYALITHMDEQIGRILEALDKSGKRDNTWIFFTADHGLGVGRHGLMGKQNMYDHSLRVPFMVIGPGVAKGKKIDAPIYLQDVMPTTLELAGVKKPEHVDFNSVLPMVRGKEKKSAYSSIYGGFLKLQRAVIADNHKLILYPTIGVSKLYNLKKDPFEKKDISGTKRGQKVAAKLFAKFLKLQEETGDTVDVKSAFPKFAGKK